MDGLAEWRDEDEEDEDGRVSDGQVEVWRRVDVSFMNPQRQMKGETIRGQFRILSRRRDRKSIPDTI